MDVNSKPQQEEDSENEEELSQEEGRDLFDLSQEEYPDQEYRDLVGQEKGGDGDILEAGGDGENSLSQEEGENLEEDLEHKDGDFADLSQEEEDPGEHPEQQDGDLVVQEKGGDGDILEANLQDDLYDDSVFESQPGFLEEGDDAEGTCHISQCFLLFM